MNAVYASTQTTLASVEIPDDWSPQQALAVYEFLNDVAELIWNRYDTQIIELIRPDLDEYDPPHLDLSDSDGDIPF